MKLPSTTRRKKFQQRILAWFAAHQRDLPWRKTRDPYRILVSEIMLQQTQVSRVIPRYFAFLQEFPTVRALAAAPRSSVLRQWSGLGYNRRAINLQRSAQELVREYKGKFPADVELLEALPGIGPYTARAVAAFAFEISVAMVDTNVERVLTRFFVGLDTQPKLSTKEMAVLAASVLPSTQAWKWGHAMMDFGATVCIARDPLCETCPLRNTCQAFPQIQKLRQQGKALPRTKRPASPFHDSSRFYRGRIVALLTVEAMSAAQLFRHIQKSYPKAERTRFTTALDALGKERIVERVKGRLRLRDS
ncbi:MAG: A/G-specific adenine glycosylase [Candidatus Nomurabacteria bacterium]|nr:MAG: A/G-specific adenine glycosylase [Candidatus Nomurabacteria bacterium]